MKRARTPDKCALLVGARVDLVRRYLTEQLNKLGLAYIHMVEGRVRGECVRLWAPGPGVRGLSLVRCPS